MIRRSSPADTSPPTSQKSSLDSLGLPMSISRKSSRRSTGSNTTMPTPTGPSPKGERPESVALFAKTLFGRRARMQREGSTSSNHSFLADEPSVDPLTGPLTDPLACPPAPQVSVFEKDKEPFSLSSLPSMVLMPSMPSILKRRKAKADSALSSLEESRVGRRFQISEPYNFQHVTHTCREEVVTATESPFYPHTMQPPPPEGSFRNFRKGSAFSDLTDLQVAAVADPITAMAMGTPFLAVPDQNWQRPRSSSLHAVGHCRSTEHMRPSPVRPPRPERPFLELPPIAPVPPPRTSSRQSFKPGEAEGAVPGPPPALTPLSLSLSALRPQTSGAIVCHEPFTLDPERLIPPPLSSPVTALPPPMELKRERRPTLAKMVPEKMADVSRDWPLPEANAGIEVAVTDHDANNTTNNSNNGMEVLPRVAEEAEDGEDLEQQQRRRSRASLSASRSVPALRKLAEAEPPSATLGRGNLAAVQHVLKPAPFRGGKGKAALSSDDDDSWADDIDYCYEHDANADFDYEWNRPSVDISRSFEDRIRVHEIDRTIADIGGSPRTGASVPALSPSSRASGRSSSSSSSSKATTPTGPSANSLDLPRVEMLASADSSAESVVGFERNGDDDITVKVGNQRKMRSRSSTVTTAPYTDDDSRSVFDVVADRHTSISSSQTTLTRYTSSTGSLKRRTSWKKQLEGASPDQGERPVTPAKSPTPTGHLSPEPAVAVAAASGPEWLPLSGTPRRKSAEEHKSPGHVSSSSDTTSIILDQAKSPEQGARPRRQRARTMTVTGAGSPPPTYGLFPRASASRNRA